MAELTVAFGFSLFAGLSTGLGGLIVALKNTPSQRFLAGALGLSAGVMVFVSLVELLPEGVDGLSEAGRSRPDVWAAVAFFAGIALIAVIDRFVPEEINPHEGPDVRAAGRMRRVGVMTALAIAIHNFPEGFATFFVALQDPAFALPIAVAIAIHNIPEGIAVAVPMREATGSKWRAAWWATLSGLAEPLGAVVGYLLLRPFIGPEALGVVFAAIAGVMVFVSIDKLLPTAIETGRHHTAIYGFVAGMAVMAVSLLLLA
ncbi:zinc transporter ZupT [Corynebacterium sp. CCUG 65737]|uniref:zinc transporter ZupT n=1 Tax=Corynebacterium sp. CCUG 65737 TaxID=2823889 RepID=UPI00210D5BEA|nr:zinc transporter ZupT [Corynebacterium sp. CCUG 65737]MCQ4627489.1 zinc transporter ZupT [Corynebacterium sp. CCUG 65737]